MERGGIHELEHRTIPDGGERDARTRKARRALLTLALEFLFFACEWEPPAGVRLVFHSDRSGDLEVFSILADGSAPVDLTRDPALDGTPAWASGVSPSADDVISDLHTSVKTLVEQGYVLAADARPLLETLRAASSHLLSGRTGAGRESPPGVRRAGPLPRAERTDAGIHRRNPRVSDRVPDELMAWTRT